VKVLIAGDLVGWKDLIGHGLFSSGDPVKPIGVNRPNCTPSVPTPRLIGDTYLVIKQPWTGNDSLAHGSPTMQTRVMVKRNHAIIFKQLLTWHIK
jgi:hypothetical protein